MSNENFAGHNADEVWEKQKQREHALKVKAVTDFVKAYERQKFGGDVGVTFYLIRYLKELEHKKASEQ